MSILSHTPAPANPIPTCDCPDGLPCECDGSGWDAGPVPADYCPTGPRPDDDAWWREQNARRPDVGGMLESELAPEDRLIGSLPTEFDLWLDRVNAEHDRMEFDPDPLREFTTR